MRKISLIEEINIIILREIIEISLFLLERIFMLINEIDQLYKARKLTKQQYRTIKGQINSGDLLGAEKGLNRLLQKEKYADNRNQ